MKYVTFGLAVVFAMSGMASAQTAAPPFENGGVYCFEVGGHEGENFQHLKIAVEPRLAPPPYSILPVHAIVRGQLDGLGYTNQYSGTAMELPADAKAAGGPRLVVGLTGNGVGTNPAGESEIWSFHYSLDLDAQTLTGMIYGIEDQSEGLNDAQTIGTLSRVAIKRAVTPMSCESEF